MFVYWRVKGYSSQVSHPVICGYGCELSWSHFRFFLMPGPDDHQPPIPHGFTSASVRIPVIEGGMTINNTRSLDFRPWHIRLYMISYICKKKSSRQFSRHNLILWHNLLYYPYGWFRKSCPHLTADSFNLTSKSPLGRQRCLVRPFVVFAMFLASWFTLVETAENVEAEQTSNWMKWDFQLLKANFTENTWKFSGSWVFVESPIFVSSTLCSCIGDTADVSKFSMTLIRLFRSPFYTDKRP